MECISVTLLVLNLLKSKFFKDVHPLNIENIFVTFDVSKLLIFIVSNVQ